MMADFRMLGKYCEIGAWEDKVLRKHLPGPYTFILRSRRACAAAKDGKLGVRIPDSEFCQKLCASFGKPVVTTSANITGREPPVRFDDIDRKVADAAAVAIDAGPTKYGKPSAIIDLVERKLIRQSGEKIDIDLAGF
jgi:tRNA threonylcarbamoyl adenosine modification protein (Sua5/YciO/YrdC/YwlC family)